MRLAQCGPMDPRTLEILVITLLCVMAFVSVIVATVKGRSLAWCIPCVLFPPFLILLLRLTPTRRVGQVHCEACQFWNPVRRDTCARCGIDIRDPDFVA